MHRYELKSDTTPARLRTTDEEAASVRRHAEALLDDALAATFPCSDPVSSLGVG
jgi:hypothetical protein